MEFSLRQTVLFALGVCAVCSVLVSAAAVGLHDRQVANQILDQQKNVLRVAGLMQPGEALSREEIGRRFEENLEPRVVELASGAYDDSIDPLGYDQRRAASRPETSQPAPPNPAKVRRLPRHARVFLIKPGDEVEGLILPIEGMGLWSVLYGYLALESDARTIRGITYFEHGETAGLGGEVDNPAWKALWPGRRAFDDDWEPRIAVARGRAGPPEQDPYRVDGLSGATLTSNGVTNMLQFWLGDHGFGPYLAAYRAEGGIE